TQWLQILVEAHGGRAGSLGRWAVHLGCERIGCRGAIAAAARTACATAWCDTLEATCHDDRQNEMDAHGPLLHRGHATIVIATNHDLSTAGRHATILGARRLRGASAAGIHRFAAGLVILKAGTLG